MTIGHVCGAVWLRLILVIVAPVGGRQFVDAAPVPGRQRLRFLGDILAALDLDHFEPLRRSIRIERTLSDVKGTVQIGEPKTRAAVRAITLPTWLVDVMARHLAAWPVSQNRHLFTSPEGGYLRATNFRRRVWKPAVLESVGEPMRFHDLRHSHVALLIEQGVHPAVVASRLGHTSVRTVLDVYGHLYEGLDRDAADALVSPWDVSHVAATWSRADYADLTSGL
jgi:integrase